MNSKLLVWVTALEGCQDHLIEIPDSPVPIPIPTPGENLPVEINNGVNDAAAQAITEDQVEGIVRKQVTIEEGGVFGVAGEFYEEEEDIIDVFRQVEAQEAEIPRYRPPPNYKDPNYIPDVQE